MSKIEMVDFKPAAEDGGPPKSGFFVMTDRRNATHRKTLRYRVAGASLIGVEVAGFNAHAAHVFPNIGALPDIIAEHLNALENRDG